MTIKYEESGGFKSKGEYDPLLPASLRWAFAPIWIVDFYGTFAEGFFF